MKAVMITTLKKPLILVMSAIIVSVMISACGSSGDDQNDLVKLPPASGTDVGGNSMISNGGTDSGETDPGGSDSGASTTEGTSTEAELNPALYNGRHSVDLGSLVIREENSIDYDSRSQQILYSALDSVTVVVCVGTLTILTEDVGAQTAYTNFVQATEAKDTNTVSVVNIEGPTDNFGIEYIYSFDAETTNLTSVVHVNYFDPDDVTFNNPAVTSVECATATDRFGQNELQFRTVLNSVEFKRGSDL